MLRRAIGAAAVLALLRGAALCETESALIAAASVQPLAIPFFIDRRLPRALKPALDEALRRLSDSRCAEIFTDFVDMDGRRLDRNLAEAGASAPSYLGLVLFYDGRPTEPCNNSAVLAWTNPGSRAVHICWNQFSAQQRWNAGLAANTIIHETLHTLGLGETPPDPREITERVALRCGR
ncbi:MAG: hypothetical protein WAU32_02145 [Thermoanaerobaculia bacterium]